MPQSIGCISPTARKPTLNAAIAERVLPRVVSRAVKNTPISLDIVFIGVDRRINNIETAVPYSLESVQSVGEVIAVFEIRGGLATELGIKPGDKVEWSID